MEDDILQMQLDFERHFLKKKENISKPLPINKYVENKLIALGSHQARLLCKVKSVYIEPSQAAKDLQKKCDLESKVFEGEESIKKFWEKRCFLFEKFEEGIKLDEESWFSVTP